MGGEERVLGASDWADERVRLTKSEEAKGENFH